MSPAVLPHLVQTIGTHSSVYGCTLGPRACGAIGPGASSGATTACCSPPAGGCNTGGGTAAGGCNTGGDTSGAGATAGGCTGGGPAGAAACGAAPGAPLRLRLFTARPASWHIRCFLQASLADFSFFFFNATPTSLNSALSSGSRSLYTASTKGSPRRQSEESSSVHLEFALHSVSSQSNLFAGGDDLQHAANHSLSASLCSCPSSNTSPTVQQHWFVS